MSFTLATLETTTADSRKGRSAATAESVRLETLLMAAIVVVHGILNEFLGAESLALTWRPALIDGLRAAGCQESPTISCAYYGDLFRQSGTKSTGPPLLTANDIAEGLEERLLLEWWAAAFTAQPDAVPSPEGHTKVSWPNSAQRAITALMNSLFFRGLAGQYGERALIFALRQVRLYLEDETLRKTAQARLQECLTPETVAVVAHSLGSVVAYEVLVSRSDSMPITFVTMGSPLGMTPIVFDRLKPPPRNGVGSWPNVKHWRNLADIGDIVALVKNLSPLFGTGNQIQDTLVANGWRSHDTVRYLTARETGQAIASALAR